MKMDVKKKIKIYINNEMWNPSLLMGNVCGDEDHAITVPVLC